MADVQEASLYDRDFHQWALDQARAVRDLRDAAALPGNTEALRQALDWDNLIEELEGLAKGVRSELRNRIATIIEHLVKLALSTATEPQPGWKAAVRRSRREIEDLLNENPSLRREIPDILQARGMAKTAAQTVEELSDRGEIPRTTPAPVLTQSQILGEWFPGQEGHGV